MAVASTNWLAGAELGHRFTDVRLVRAGSRFTIYEGRELGGTRMLAIKVPDGSGSSPWLNEVAEHEATVLANVGSHPHVVTLYQRITLDDGRPALLLERCTGTLYDSVRNDDEAMSVRDVVSTGIKLAGALETLHRNGVLHCDVRPRTVLVSEWGEPDTRGAGPRDPPPRRGGRPGGAPPPPVVGGGGGAPPRAVSDNGADHTPRGPPPPLHTPPPPPAPNLRGGADPPPASDVYGL